MAADRTLATLLDALRQALSASSEQRMHRNGKLSGLFPSRGGVSAEAAARAIRDGLLEVVRTEEKGKTVIEWVRLTPPGVNFLHEHESPRRALEELRELLSAAGKAVPVRQAEMQQELRTLAERLSADSQRWLEHIGALRQRVEESLRRLESAVPRVSDRLAAEVPWAADALGYLERRHENGASGECPLPELFAAVADGRADFSVAAFHDGLRRLGDRGLLRLLPFAAPPDELPQPEYALLDGATMLYYAGR